jgi:hypothetical protein
LRVVKVADGAKDNWTFLSEELPAGEEIIDFYHAAEHLKAAFAVAYGENTSKARLRPIGTSCVRSTVESAKAACCYANSDKYWIQDPQGIAWETFHTLGGIPVYGQDNGPIALPSEGACCVPLAKQPKDKLTAACCVPNAKAPDSTAACCG